MKTKRHCSRCGVPGHTIRTCKKARVSMALAQKATELPRLAPPLPQLEVKDEWLIDPEGVAFWDIDQRRAIAKELRAYRAR